MTKTNQNYINAQLTIYAPLSHEKGSNGQCSIVLRSERGKTKNINIDAQCARDIEAALLSMAERKDREQAL